MQVDPKDGNCRSCGGVLEITDADDATMTVICSNPDCGDSYPVETDAFNDGGMHYYVQVMGDRLERRKGA